MKKILNFQIVTKALKTSFINVIPRKIELEHLVSNNTLKLTKFITTNVQYIKQTKKIISFSKGLNFLALVLLQFAGLKIAQLVIFTIKKFLSY